MKGTILIILIALVSMLSAEESMSPHSGAKAVIEGNRSYFVIQQNGFEYNIWVDTVSHDYMILTMSASRQVNAGVSKSKSLKVLASQLKDEALLAGNDQSYLSDSTVKMLKMDKFKPGETKIYILGLALKTTEKLKVTLLDRNLVFNKAG